VYKQVLYAMKYTTGYYRDLLCNPMAHTQCAVIIMIFNPKLCRW